MRKRIITRKRVITILLTLSVIMTMFPVWTFASSQALPSVDDAAVCHTSASDYNGGDCILTSTKTMLRRCAISQGSMLWTTITNKAIRPYAAPYGALKFTINYSNDGIKYTVKHKYFKSKSKIGKIREIKKLLKTHPEGIVVWGGNATKSGTPHGVLVVKVKGNTVYAIDSAYNKGSVSKGTLKWSRTIMGSIKRCSAYWYLAEATGKSASASGKKAASTLTITGATAPATLKKGDSFSLYGEIDSNYIIKSVDVEIADSKGNIVIAENAMPDDWFFDIHSMDSRIRFGKLAKGNYTYRITAADEKKTLILLEKDFKVKSSSAKTASEKETAAASAAVIETDTSEISTITISNASQPDSVKEGNGFGVTGKIKSNEKLTMVKVSILDSKNREKISYSVKPGKKSYNLVDLDQYIKFGTLVPGTYTYVVTAADKTQTIDLIQKSFDVVKKSTLRLKSYTYPDKLAEGEPFTIKGMVRSNKKITKVWIVIRDASGRKAISKSAKPNAKKYDLAGLDSKIRFGKLETGKYTYNVIAKDTEQKKTLISKSFTIN